MSNTKEFQNVSFPHAKYVNYDEIEDLQNDIESEIECIESDIEEKESEIEDLESELSDYENDETDLIDIKLSLDNQINELKSEIDSLNVKLNSYNEDLSLIESIIHNISSDETLINESYFDSYIEDRTNYIYPELKDLPNIVIAHLDFNGMYDDIKQDYSEIEIEGTIYYFLYN